jgi:hypothetical protein
MQTHTIALLGDWLRPPHQAAPIADQDRDEAAAIAGAKAEAKGLPIWANPYRQTPPLRFA